MGTYASGSGSYGEDAAYYDEVGDDPSLTNGRRGTIFIVDIGPEMFEKDAHGDYYMKKSLIQMRNYLNSIALTANMSDRVRIIFINAASFRGSVDVIWLFVFSLQVPRTM